MVGVAAQQRPAAVDLLGQHDAHQRVGQGEAGQAQAFGAVAFQDGVQAVRAADDQGHRAELLSPGVHPRGEAARIEVDTLLVEGDATRALGHGRPQARGFAAHPGGGAARPGAGFGLDLAPLHPHLGGHARAVFGHRLIDPGRHASAHGQDSDQHAVD